MKLVREDFQSTFVSNFPKFTVALSFSPTLMKGLRHQTILNDQKKEKKKRKKAVRILQVSISNIQNLS